MKQQKEQGLNKRIQRGKKGLLKRIRKAKKRFKQTQKKWLDHMLRSNKKMDEKVKSLAREIDSINYHILSLECQLRSEQGNLRYAEESFNRSKEALMISKKSFIDHKKELKKLMKLPHVLAVEIVHNAMRVYTDTIHITQNSRQYEIGAFEITLSLKFDHMESIGCSTYSRLKFKNITNTRSVERAHPYICGTNFCFGDLEWDIDKAFQQQDFVLAFIYILQALQNGKGDYDYLVPEWKEVAYGTR